jgi:hypothetical protein
VSEDIGSTFLIGGGEYGSGEIHVGGLIRFGNYEPYETWLPVLTLELPESGGIGTANLNQALRFLHALKSEGYVAMVDPGGQLDAAFCTAVAFYAIELRVPVDEAMEAARQIFGDVEVGDQVRHKLAGYIMIVGPRLRDEWEQADAAPSP